jgi:MoxR-like ATPase
VTHERPEPAVEQVLFEVKRVIVGQDRMVERILVALLARGHCLLEGVPGVAKTLAVQTIADVVGGTFSRLQFTPDLVPSDIVGTRVYRPSREGFDVELGPIVANLVLADEINRAPAKVQSALLEAMAERQVSIGGTTHPLPRPFVVLATQNPIESEGVYALPEAQRDRFLMKLTVGYPTGGEELAILHRMSVEPPRARRILTPQRLVEMQETADRVFVHHAVAEYVVRLVLATRDPGCVRHARAGRRAGLRRESARDARDRRGGPWAGRPEGPGLRPARRRPRRRGRRDGPPAGPDLRRGGRRPRPAGGRRAGCLGRPRAARCSSRGRRRRGASRGGPSRATASHRGTASRRDGGMSAAMTSTLRAVTAPPRLGDLAPEQALRRLELTVLRRLDGCCRATISAGCPVRAASRPRHVPTAQVRTTSAASTGR